MCPGLREGSGDANSCDPDFTTTPVTEVTVPSFPAETKEQFLKGRALWPINYYPPSHPPPLTDIEKDKYENAMRRALHLGEEAGCNGNAPVGMVILDADGSVLAECGDNRSDMFLDHCCFCGVRRRSNQLRARLGGKPVLQWKIPICVRTVM